MKKQNIIKKSEDFTRLIKKRNGSSNEYFIINQETNNEKTTKFGITFTKKIGNAVVRNKLKRRVKAIIDHHKEMYQSSKNYVIIIRKAAKEINYQELEKNLVSLFLKIKSKGEQNEK